MSLSSPPCFRPVWTCYSTPSYPHRSRSQAFNLWPRFASKLCSICSMSATRISTLLRTTRFPSSQQSNRCSRPKTMKLTRSSCSSASKWTWSRTSCFPTPANGRCTTATTKSQKRASNSKKWLACTPSRKSNSSAKSKTCSTSNWSWSASWSNW